jgi:predicted SAM-dependent methyltransferase
MVLNVGGNSREIAIASQYHCWQQDLLDIDASQKPDILADARELTEQQAEIYDAVYCPHNLEHYYLHDAKKVLQGFRHVLKPNGHAYITVPDMRQVMERVVNENLAITDILYQSPMGPIHVYDVLYGHQEKIEYRGEEYFAHKIGFTLRSLRQILLDADFPIVAISVARLNLSAIAFMRQPTEAQCNLFGIVYEN